ncbi:unnamed protein product, partial [Tetraodon nigroviridis]
MSVTPFTTLDNELISTWGPPTSYPDGPMVVSGYFSPLWSGCESQPQFWTKFQVWEWLQQVLDMHQMDTSNFPFQNFNVDGHQLCNLSHQDYVCAAGSVGSILFQRVTELKWGDQRGTHLWEFIRDILLNPERNPGLIKWEDRTEGVFRFLKSEAVAQLWGKKKNNSSMTYEKLSRAMRYYYKREILERVDGRRLVYKFGRNARGWRESEK